MEGASSHVALLISFGDVRSAGGPASSWRSEPVAIPSSRHRYILRSRRTQIQHVGVRDGSVAAPPMTAQLPIVSQ